MFASSVVNVGYSCPVKLVSTICGLEVHVLNANTPLYNLTCKHVFSPYAQCAINSENSLPRLVLHSSVLVNS